MHVQIPPLLDQLDYLPDRPFFAAVIFLLLMTRNLEIAINAIRFVAVFCPADVSDQDESGLEICSRDVAVLGSDFGKEDEAGNVGVED